jgi:hypothetical protein
MPACKECGDYPAEKDLKDGVCKRCRALHVEPVDFRPITRNADKIVTRVMLGNPFSGGRKLWLTLGECKLFKPVERDSMRWRLDAYLPYGVTDFEHDSAHAVILPLLAVTHGSSLFGHLWFDAIIDPTDPEDFRVPDTSYNPMEHKDARQCDYDSCRDTPHIVVPEGFYIPPSNPKLFRKVAARPVVITIGATSDDEK